MEYPEKPIRRATESWPDLGGLKRVIANFLANLVGTGEYIIGVLPHPRSAEDLEVALRYAAHPAMNDVYVDKDKIVYVNIPGAEGWHAQYDAAGISVTNGKNHNKYRKSVYRPTEIGFEFPDDIDVTVKVLEADEVRSMSKEDLSAYSDEQVEMIADGMFVFNDRVWRMMLDSVEGNSSVFKTARRMQRVRKAHEFNVRLLSEAGFVKGDAVRAHGKLPGDVMFYTSRANVKGAMKVLDGGKRFLIAQPNGGKSQAFSNIQELAWFSAVPNGTTQLFTMERLNAVLADHLEKSFQEITSGTLNERFSDPESFVWRLMKDLDDEGINNTFTMLQRWSVIEAAMRGFDYRTSPSMLASVAINHRTTMRDFNGHPRFPLPNAEYKAVKSVTMLRMAGYKVKTPQRGFIEYHEPMDVWYVCDRDWIDSYIDFGGQDGDDHFTVMSIVDSNGEHRIITWRMPMDSYKMFRTNSGGISYTDAKGNQTFAFQMSRNSDVNKFPKPLSQLIDEGKVTITGLPSQKRDKSNAPTHKLTREDVMDEIRALSGQNAALGAYVNSLFLYRWVFRTLPAQIPGMVSDVVDTNDPEDAEFILEYSAKLVKEVFDSGRPIPRSYWETTREYGFNLVLESYMKDHPGYKVNFSSDDKLGRMTKMLDDAIRQFDRRVDTFGQESHALIDSSIPALFTKDDPIIREAQQVVRAFRGRFPEETRRKEEDYQEAVRNWDGNGEAPTKPKSFSSEAWLRIREDVMSGITSREGDDRDRFVLALYVVAHTMPLKTSKKFNDNFLVSSQVDGSGSDVGPFPHFIQALRNYGYVADTFTIDDDGHLDPEYLCIRTWTLTCNECGSKYHTARQDQYDSYMANGGICKRCRS
jgi:hypothetical protein